MLMTTPGFFKVSSPRCAALSSSVADFSSRAADGLFHVTKVSARSGVYAGVYRDEVPHNFPNPHTDVLEQFIDYRVPADKYDDLARYDRSVIPERTKGEVSARCDMEEMNFLALSGTVPDPSRHSPTLSRGSAASGRR